MEDFVPETCSLEILINSSDSEWQSIGKITSHVTSTEWETTELEVPIEFWNIETQLRFKIPDCEPTVNNFVFLRNFSTSYQPKVNIYSILQYFDDSVAGGSIIGYGRGNSANGRLNALRNMLETVSDLITIDDIEGACRQLRTASRKCDSESPPPDFVAGSAVSELNDMIMILMADLGCE